MVQLSVGQYVILLNMQHRIAVHNPIETTKCKFNYKQFLNNKLA